LAKDKQNRIVGVVGRKGSGKSTLADEIGKPAHRMVWFDTMAEHEMPDTVSDLGELHVYLKNVEDPKEKFRVRYIPRRGAAKVDNQDYLIEQFNAVCAEVYDCGNLLFGVEETPMLSKGPAWVPPAFDEIIRLGRHQQVSTLWTAQRMAEIPRRLTAATDLFVLFCHTEPRDLNAIEERCGFEVKELVQQLGLHDFIAYDVQTRTILTEEEFLQIDPLKPLRSGDESTQGPQKRKQLGLFKPLGEREANGKIQ
jgi:hypothetical protein